MLPLLAPTGCLIGLVAGLPVLVSDRLLIRCFAGEALGDRSVAALLMTLDGPGIGT